MLISNVAPAVITGATGFKSNSPELRNLNYMNLMSMLFAGVTTSISHGSGLQLEPGALQHVPGTRSILLSSGLLPTAYLATALKLLLPGATADEHRG